MANLHIYSQNFDTKDIVRVEKGSKQAASNNIQPTKSSKWPKWMRREDKSDLKFPAKSRCASLWRITTIFFRGTKTKSDLRQLKKAYTVKKSVSVSCKTDIDQLEMEERVKNVARLKTENTVLQNKVNKAAMKHELFMDNLLKNDEAVKFIHIFQL